MKLQIIKPDSTLFDGEATEVIIPGTEGSMGILNNHAPMIASIKDGEIKVKHSGKTEMFPVKSGVAEVNHNEVIILVE